MSKQAWEIPSAEGAIETIEVEKRQAKRDYRTYVGEKLIRFWFDHMKIEEEDGVKYGFVAAEWILGDVNYELNEYENDRADVRTAVRLLAEKGWMVSPQFGTSLVFFTAVKGIRLRALVKGEESESADSWVNRLPRWTLA